MSRWDVNVPLIFNHPRQPCVSAATLLSRGYALKAKVVLSWSFRGKNSQIRQKLHLMAISAKGQSPEQAFFGYLCIQRKFIILNVGQALR